MSTATTLSFGTTRVELTELRAYSVSGEQPLTPLEVELLTFLVANRGTTVSRERLLAEVWGYSTKSVTRAVDNTVSRLRRKIEADPRDPRWIVSTRGGGYRLERDPAEEALMRVGNVPAARDSFVGRAHELAAIGAAFGASRLITLLGPGGTGKTRLAYEFARQGAVRYPGGTWVVDLTQAHDRNDVLQSIAAAVHVPLRSGDPTAQLAAALAHRASMLLVLDNCDQATDGVADVVSVCLDRAPDLRVLATSRQPLRLRGEQRRPVEPLTLPNRDTLDAAEDSDAVDLFVQRSRSAVPGFALTTGNAAEVARLVYLLDGLPLALELAAANTDHHSVRELATGLKERLDGLTSAERDRPDRHQSLSAALDWASGRLSPAERQALARLSQFEGGFTLEAAIAVVAHEDAEALLRSLVDKSLVRTWVSRSTGADRFGLFVTIRVWARETLTDTHPLATEDRFVAWFASYGAPDARRALRRFGGPARRRALAEELDNLFAAARIAIRRQDTGLAVAACRATWEVLFVTGLVHLGAALADQILQLPGLLMADRAAIERIAGLGRDRAGDPEGGMIHYEAGLSAARSAGDRETEAMILGNIGGLHWRAGRIDDAEGLYRAALNIGREIGDRDLCASTSTNLGLVHRARGQVELALDAHVEALAIRRESGDRLNESHAADQLAILLGHLGRFDEAAEVRETALEAAREVGDRWSEAILLGNQGNLEWQRGNHDQALPLLIEALAAHRLVGDRRSEALIRGTLGVVHAELGQFDQGYQHLAAGLALLRESHDRLRVAALLGWFGWIQAVRGERAEAERSFAEGEDALREIVQPGELAQLYTLRARAEHGWGDRHAARRTLARARSLAHEAGVGPTSSIAARLAATEALVR
ncbi:MAG: tetratricopeptide repeat protein [Myxococcota bacterium]